MTKNQCINVPEPKLSITCGSPIECGVCGTDFTKSLIQLHHISYSDNVAAYVCQQCHNRIHSKQGFMDDMKPEEKSQNALGKIYKRADYSVHTHLRPKHYYLVKCASEKTDITEGTLIAGLVNKILSKHNGDILEAINAVDNM